MPLDYQKTFDTVARALIKQGRPSTSRTAFGDDKCVYRGDEGRRCAVGVLIPDESFDLTWDELAVVPGEAGSYWPEMAAAIGADPVHDVPFLSALQAAHDVGLERWVVRWTDAMRKAAKDFSLDPAVLDEVPSDA